jgi:hypothetical protein
MTHSMMTLSIATLSTPISMTILSITIENRDTQKKTLSLLVKIATLSLTLCRVSFMQNVAFKPIVPSGIMLNVLMLSVVAPLV